MKTRLIVSILAALGVVGVWAVLTRRPDHQHLPPVDSRWLTDDGAPVLRMYDVRDLIDEQVEFSRSLGEANPQAEAVADELADMVAWWGTHEGQADCVGGRLMVRASPTGHRTVAAGLAHLRAAAARANGSIE